MADMLARAAAGRALDDADTDAEAARMPPTLHPLRFLGMGLLVAWLCCTHVPDIFCGESDAVRRVMDIGMRCGDIGAFLVFALLAPQIGALGSRLKPSGVLVALSSAGTAVIGIGMAQTDALAILTLISVVTAVGGAALFCLWAEVYAQMHPSQMVVYGAGSCVAAFLFYALISTMIHPYEVISTALLPLGSFACAVASFKLVPREPVRRTEARYAVPWKIVAIMTVAGFASGVAGAMLLSVESQGAVHRILATVVVGGIILALALLRSRTFDLRLLAHVSVPLSVAAFLLLPAAWSSVGIVVSFLIKLAYVWFTVFALMLLASLCFRYEIPTLRLFAVARACSEAAIFAGITLRRFLQDIGFAQSPALLTTCAIIGLLGVVACVFLWRSERAVNADWGAAGIEIESGERIVGARERLIVRCEQLAQEYGLTPREAEVLTLIAQRKTRSEIEQELFLSQNTVKTHVRHVYAKLGVHSKADVYELAGD